MKKSYSCHYDNELNSEIVHSSRIQILVQNFRNIFLVCFNFMKCGNQKCLILVTTSFVSLIIGGLSTFFAYEYLIQVVSYDRLQWATVMLVTLC